MEDVISYYNNLMKGIKNEDDFENCTAVLERMDYLKEEVKETETELEYSKDQDAKVGYKTAYTSFFGYKTHIAMTPKRVITTATITSGEKTDGKEMESN